MKNFKLKLFSLILCVCMCLSIFTGCSLWTKNSKANAEEVVMKVGNREITRDELLNAYYSFYQQNSYYYMYYDEETILNTFYDSVVSRYMILSEAERLIKENTLVFSDKDLKDVWEDLFDYINAQVDTKEKAILLQKNGNKEDELPERLKSDDSKTQEETPYKYEAYERKEVEAYEKGTPAEEVDDEYITQKIKEFKETGLYTYYNEEADSDDEDKERTPLYIENAEEKAVRVQAFEKYLADLMFSAKANKKDSSEEAVLRAEVERIYKSYYESKLYSEYQEYILSTSNADLMGNFSDSKIVEKYLKLYNVSYQNNVVEDNYVKVITDSSNSSLVLYHYNGKYVYFTVQHILVSFDDETLEILKGIDGYDASKDNVFRTQYELIRQSFYEKGRAWDENEEHSILSTTERDDKGYIVREKPTEEGKLGKEVKVSVDEIVNLFEEEYLALLGANPTWTAEQKTEARTLLFQKYTYKYSADTGSLSNTIPGVLGFTISSETDNHGNYVKDFTNGARELFEAYKTYKAGNGGTADDDIGAIKEVVSDYGVHIMMLTGVYEAGPVVDLSALTGTTDAEREAEIVSILKSKKISSLTTETYYDYIYDLIKEELTGSNGTYFTDYRNQLAYDFEKDGKIEYKNKLTYDQLSSSIS